MDEFEPEIRSAITRRRMLKRIGAATAMAWTVPVLSTVGTPAFAQYGRCPADCADNPCGVNPEANCGQNPQTGQPCLCAQDLGAQGCDCFQPICGAGPACGAAGECPAGYGCVSCCGEPFQCAPLCETPVAAQAAGGSVWG